MMFKIRAFIKRMFTQAVVYEVGHDKAYTTIQSAMDAIPSNIAAFNKSRKWYVRLMRPYVQHEIRLAKEDR